MAIATSVAPFEAQLWPQGDARDPLGIWACRLGVTGDASGNPITVTVRVPADKRSAYVYTCYHASVVQLTGAITAAFIKTRLLTNWPDADPAAGVTGYSTWAAILLGGTLSNFTAPVAGPAVGSGANLNSQVPLIQPLERFLLLFDPRQPESLGPLDILELQLEVNTDAATYSFEAYGYFWDRSVLQAPGGPRHPGSS